MIFPHVSHEIHIFALISPSFPLNTLKSTCIDDDFLVSHELPRVKTRRRQGLDRHEAYCPKAFAVSGHACATVQVTVPHAHVRTPLSPSDGDFQLMGGTYMSLPWGLPKP